MSNSAIVLKQLISSNGMQEIDKWIAKYPVEQKKSAVMMALRIVQEECGYLTHDAIVAVANYLNMPEISVYEVATFYTMYNLEPLGKNQINICRSISCKLGGAEKIIAHVENKLNLKLGETTADGRFTLRTAECLGACVGAPMMRLNTDYHENLTPEKVDEILEQYS